jgi:hypothetical protein
MATTDQVKRMAGKLRYRGIEFPGYNKPRQAPAGSKHKMIVLAKKGDQVKVVRFGHRDYEDFTQHGSEKRRENYLKRSAGIKDGSGKLTKNDKFSANYWARTKLW